MEHLIITVFMSMSANSNMCQFLVSFNRFSPSLWVIFFCFFPCLVIFDWIAGIVNYTLLAAQTLCIPITTLELCPGMQLSYFESLTLLRLIRQNQSLVLLGLIISHY